MEIKYFALHTASYTIPGILMTWELNLLFHTANMHLYAKAHMQIFSSWKQASLDTPKLGIYSISVLFKYASIRAPLI